MLLSNFLKNVKDLDRWIQICIRKTACYNECKQVFFTVKAVALHHMVHLFFIGSKKIFDRNVRIFRWALRKSFIEWLVATHIVAEDLSEFGLVVIKHAINIGKWIINLIVYSWLWLIEIFNRFFDRFKVAEISKLFEIHGSKCFSGFDIFRILRRLKSKWSRRFFLFFGFLKLVEIRYLSNFILWLFTVTFSLACPIFQHPASLLGFAAFLAASFKVRLRKDIDFSVTPFSRFWRIFALDKGWANKVCCCEDRRFQM